jgi:hypothetical protein
MSSESGSSRANSDTPDKSKKEKPTPKLSKVKPAHILFKIKTPY